MGGLHVPEHRQLNFAFERLKSGNVVVLIFDTDPDLYIGGQVGISTIRYRHLTTADVTRDNHTIIWLTKYNSGGWGYLQNMIGIAFPV